MLESYWAEIGWALHLLRSQPRKPTHEQLAHALEPLRGRYNAERILYYFRTAGEAASSQTIRQTLRALTKSRKQERKLKQVSNDHEERCLEALRAIERTKAEIADAEKNEEHAIARAKQKILESANEATLRRFLEACRPCEVFKKTTMKGDAIHDRLEEQEAYYFREQALRFLRDKRYELTPHNLAAAITGLPRLSYRKSIELCLKTEAEIEAKTGNKRMPQLAFRILEFVQANLRRGETLKGNALLDFFQSRIKKLAKKDDLRTYLAENWIHLKNAILEATKADCVRAELPYFVARLFEKNRASCTTDVDRLLAAKEALWDG
ncbi:MAG: hypothetical protein HY234_10160 [Acidobacteria bacterium]|nr:hypothetical protein [Acidobacteriota bacterium]